MITYKLKLLIYDTAVFAYQFRSKTIADLGADTLCNQMTHLGFSTPVVGCCHTFQSGVLLIGNISNSHLTHDLGPILDAIKITIMTA